MQELIEQMEEIEKNAKNINDSELLIAMNKKYRDLEDKINKVIMNTDVIFNKL